MPLSPGDPLDGPDGELVGAPDGGGVTMGRGVSPLVEGAAEAVDVRGVVGPGVDDRAAFEGTVTRAEVPGELTVSLLMVLLMVEAGTAVPCSPELQATAVAGSAATSAARTARRLTLLIRRRSSPARP